MCQAPEKSVFMMVAPHFLEISIMSTNIATTPYLSLGGEPGVQRLVQRFYELMDVLPEAHTVRQMHPPSLAGSAESLFEFLSGWFGGPSLYIAKKGLPGCACGMPPMRWALSCAMNGCCA